MRNSIKITLTMAKDFRSDELLEVQEALKKVEHLIRDVKISEELIRKPFPNEDIHDYLGVEKLK